MSRRESLATLAAAGGMAALASPSLAVPACRRSVACSSVGALTLPELPFAFNALEPHIDAETMEIHHDRHHKAYVDNANKALDGTKFADLTPEQIITQLGDAPDDKRTAIRNNVGGHVNHSLFWTLMAPADKGGGGEPSGALADAIATAFGSFSGSGGLKEKFAAAASSRFGSGWAWLCVLGGKLAICSTANQDNPLMGEKVSGGCGGRPILGLDVWEHAYYLKYRNKRADYITAWWNVLNWSKVAELYKGAGS